MLVYVFKITASHSKMVHALYNIICSFSRFGGLLSPHASSAWPGAGLHNPEMQQLVDRLTEQQNISGRAIANNTYDNQLGHASLQSIRAKLKGCRLLERQTSRIADSSPRHHYLF